MNSAFPKKIVTAFNLNKTNLNTFNHSLKNFTQFYSHPSSFSFSSMIKLRKREFSIRNYYSSDPNHSTKNKFRLISKSLIFNHLTFITVFYFRN